MVHRSFPWALLCSVSITIGASAHAAPAVPASAPAPLSLRDALARTGAAHPALRAAAHDVAASRARERDAARIPVPALTASLENFGGELGSDHKESTVALEQPLELGGDRGARRGVAQAQTEIARAELDLLRLGAEAATADLYCQAWVLQEKVARLGEAVRSAGLAVSAAADRFRAGAAPAHEGARARAFLALRELETERAGRELSAARRQLALQWGGDADSVGTLALPPPGEIAVPAVDSLLAGLAAHPESRRAVAERRRDDESLRLARAERFPDVTLGAGARRLAEVPGTGFVAMVSLPLPLPGVGQGAVSAAQSARAATDIRAGAVRARLESELRAAHATLTSALAADRELRSRALPALEDAMRSLASGFQAGRYTYLEIQEGHRALTEARFLQLESTADAWRARLELERLTGARAPSSDAERGEPR